MKAGVASWSWCGGGGVRDACSCGVCAQVQQAPLLTAMVVAALMLLLYLCLRVCFWLACQQRPRAQKGSPRKRAGARGGTLWLKWRGMGRYGERGKW